MASRLVEVGDLGGAGPCISALVKVGTMAPFFHSGDVLSAYLMKLGGKFYASAFASSEFHHPSPNKHNCSVLKRC